MKLLVPIILSGALLGCASSPTGSVNNGAERDRNNAKIGAIVGAVAGVIVGGQLDDDGNPIYREDGKVLKGPNYQKPELGDLVPLANLQHDTSGK